MAAEAAIAQTPGPQPKAIKKEGVAKRIERLPVEILSVDRSYQRPISNKAENMGKNWQDELANVITVSLRPDGEFWIIDGQHRVAAALLAGVTHLEADIRENLSIEEEAKLFDELNSTRSLVTAIDRFRARLVYQDPEAVEINNVVNEMGGEISDVPGRTTKDDRRIKAVASLERVYKYEGPNGLREVLDELNQAFGELTNETVNELTLNGMRVLRSKKKTVLNKNRLINRMKEEGLPQLRRMAHANMQIFGGSGPQNFYRAVVEVYNKNLTAKQRIRP
jgi:hypothetical protein